VSEFIPIVIEEFKQTAWQHAAEGEGIPPA
jgi:hypothetical protein